MPETHKHVSITLTFKTDTEPGLVFVQLMELIGEKEIFIANSQVRAFELAEDQDYPSLACSCDGDPIECSHEAARGQAEATIARVTELRDKWLRWPGDDPHHGAGLMLGRYLDPPKDTE